MHRFVSILTACLLSACIVHAAPPTVGQYEIRKRTASGFDSYGVTLTNGQAIGQLAGIPAAVTIGGGGGGDATWGSITGTLADQTDLITALNAKLATATAASTYQPLITDGSLTIARTNGLQTALNNKLDAVGGSASGLVSFSILNSGTGVFNFQINHVGTLTASHTLTYNLNNSERTVSLSGNLTVSADATISGTNTGDQSKSSLGLGNVENTALSTWAGSTNITTINTTQNIGRLSNLTTNGFVKTSSSNGTLIIDTNDYQPLDSSLTALSSLADSAGVLTNNGAGTLSYTATSTGGNGAADDGKLAKYGVDGNFFISKEMTFYGPFGSTTLSRTDIASDNSVSFPISNGVLALKSDIILSNLTGLGTGLPAALAIAVGSAGAPVLYNGALGAPSSGNVTSCTAKAEIVVACSDETTALTTGTAKVTFRMPHAMTLSSVRLQVNTAPTGSVIIVDVKEAGTTIFSTKPQIATSAFTSVGGAVPGTLSDTALADDAEITINLDQIGSTIAGKGLKVTLIGTRQ